MSTWQNKKVDSLHVPAITFIGQRNYWSISFQLYFNNYACRFCELCEILGNLVKKLIFNNCLILKFESKNPFAHMWHIMWSSLSAAHIISFLHNQFSTDFPFEFCIFLPLHHLALYSLKIGFSRKKIPLIRAKTRRFFFGKTIGSNNPFTRIENNFRLLRYTRSWNSR